MRNASQQEIAKPRQTMPPSPTRTPRKALHERSDSETNILARVRLVPYTPPRLLGNSDYDDDLYCRSPLPTLPAHFLPPAGNAAARDNAWAPDRSGTDVSAHLYPATSQATPGFNAASPHDEVQADYSRPSTATSTKSRPFPKKRKHVALNPDNKTFRVLEVDQDDETPMEERRQSTRSDASLVHDGSSVPGQGIGSPSRSFVSSLSDHAATRSPQWSSPVTSPADHMSQSPWNYQFVGGLRKVPKTPDLKRKATSATTSSSSPFPDTLDNPKPLANLTAKSSFLSGFAASSASKTSNYRVHGSSPSQMYPSTPPPHFSNSNQDWTEDLDSKSHELQSGDYGPPSSSDSNYQMLGYSSEVSDNELSSHNHLFGKDVSFSPSPAAVSSSPGIRYSRESLMVPPLQPRLRRSSDQVGYYKSRSRESLRTGSITSISTMLSQEASQALVASASLVQLPASSPPGTSLSWIPSTALIPNRSLIHPHPHQWSSQLSTVPSESETDVGTRTWSEVNGPRSSGFRTSTSLRVPSINSSQFQYDHSRINSLEPPLPTHSRTSPRLVKGLDEDGDGITDMRELRLRPSRARLSDYISAASDIVRTSTIRSTTSSRANSLLASSIPAWARLYYGSGERRYLATPGSSRDGSDSRPQSSWRSGSPDTSNFPLYLYSPRKRPRQLLPEAEFGPSHRRGSMEISAFPESVDDGTLIYNNSSRRRFRPSSSVLSPHLKRDKRSSRGSKFFLEPTSIDWSSNGDVFGNRRRWLILMFISGFIFPFSWFIGALIPLPAYSRSDTDEKGKGLSNLEVSDAAPRVDGSIDELRYEGLRWWRNLNRGMAVIGVLIIAAIIVLVVIGVKQRWTK